MTRAHAPIADRVLITSQRRAIDTIGHIASVVTSITLDSIDRYLHSRHPCTPSRPSSEASSSTLGASSDVAHRAVGLPLPGDICGLSGQKTHMDMALYFLEDIFHIMSSIFNTQGIPVHSMMDVVK